MWPTVDGLRILAGAEAELARRAVRQMLDRLISQQAEPHTYGIDWFDQWDRDQKIWLLDQVTAPLLTQTAPPTAAAIWEATIDAIFLEVLESIAIESEGASSRAGDVSWRQSVWEAFRAQQRRFPKLQPDETDLQHWRTVVTQLSDAILGAPVYQRAELYRDGDIDHSRRFLIQKGLPADFLQRIPPLQSTEQTEKTIHRLETRLHSAD